MDTRKLAAFVETVRSGSINKTADILGYTKSGLTYTLRTLEEELNVELLERTPKGISLPPKGEILLPYIEAILDKTDALTKKVTEINYEGWNGKEVIRIAAYPSTTVNYLAKEIAEFTKKYPKFNFDIRVGVTNIPNWVEDEVVDIGLVDRGLAASLAVSHKWTPLRDEEFCAVLPIDCPLAKKQRVTLQELGDYRVIFPNVNEKNAVAVEIAKQKIEYKDQVNIRVEDGSVMFSLVAEGFGVSFLTSQYRSECPDNVVMLPFDPPINRTLGMLTNKDMNGKTGAAQFCKWLVKHKDRHL